MPLEMDRAELREELRRLAKIKRDSSVIKATAAADTQLEADLIAIEQIVGLAEVELKTPVEAQRAQDVVVPTRSVPDRRPSSDGPSAIVREAIAALVQQQPDFTLPEIDDWIRTNMPDAGIERFSISNVLNKLKYRREVEIAVHVPGNNPSIWRRVEQQGKANEAAMTAQAV